MQYTQLGSTGLIVSRLALGGSTFTSGDTALGAFYKVGPELADELVGMALDAGVNSFDTADVYASGQSEELLGAALKPHRDRVVLSTKVGNRGAGNREVLHSGLSRRHILWSVDQSLRRLGTDWIDVLIVHRTDPFTPLIEQLEALDAVVRSGKARYIGYSNWPAWLAATALEMQKANGLARFTHGQMYYSLLGRDVERDTLPMMAHHGLGMTVWSPLAYGFLAGRYTSADMARDDNRFAHFDWLRFDRDRAFALLPVMEAIALEAGCSMAQLAIAWLLGRAGVDSVLLGATKAHQLADNLGTAKVALSDDQRARLDAATAIVPLYPGSDWVEEDGLVRKRLGDHRKRLGEHRK
ncbi:aldo/keto reductase [Novosphingobium album (ex Liu et al. 2023)]|uniref:Aldo/keto reductase n=1 Tax=Novosphingobium album (ex Liu et al. 2023) TaxID=3031130 RepID=A0ABT5WTR6_9SPHN|nr:aldo/keto reductase [Novosphingobium album (ex Liu et al. 2023)]MDE8653285.1 aldo/keto reductase [Novosphingobium album (ex Liu et al. 2023)]